MPLPQYQCHKIVSAVRIAELIMIAGTPTIFPVISPTTGDQASIPVSLAYYNKHQPRVGGYYVRYEDGYESYSPAEAFEQGYTRIETDAKLPSTTVVRPDGQTSDELAALEETFTYHTPDAMQQEHYRAIREAAKEFVQVLLNRVPRCADRSAAIRKVREAMMTANAAIAIPLGKGL